MHLSNSTHHFKHLSIARVYLWSELCCFLRVDSPELFQNLYTMDSSVQPHMFSLASHKAPSMWTLAGAVSRPIILDGDELVILAGLYTDFCLELGLSSYLNSKQELDPQLFEKSALQIRGKLWSGQRYFRSCYFSNEDVKQFSAGSCLVAYSSGSTKQYGVIRDIWKHQPIQRNECPDLYVFVVEEFHVTMPPPNDQFQFSSYDLPLPVAKLTGIRDWISHLQLLHSTFCMKPVDSDPSSFYIIDLLA